MPILTLPSEISPAAAGIADAASSAAETRQDAFTGGSSLWPATGNAAGLQWFNSSFRILD